jgi:glucokinase
LKSKRPARFACGVDIGGTFTKIALVAADGSILRHERMATGARGDPADYLDQLCRIVELYRVEGLTGIGLSLPGFLAEDRRSIVYNPNTPALVGVDFSQLFARFGLPVVVEQDLNAPAVGEYSFGCGRDSRRFMAAAIGTGLGIGMILDGQVLRFSGGTVGDTGHIILEPDGPPCTAGCRGCGEALVTIPGIEREAARLLDDPRAAALRAVQAQKPSLAEAVICAALEGDPLAVEIITLTGRRLGQWLASLAPIFLPDRIALCGGVAVAGEVLLAACRERFYQLTGKEYAQCQIDLGCLKGLSGVVGAAAPLL